MPQRPEHSIPSSMNRAYWEAVSADYDREVMSVFEHDAGGLTRARIQAAAASCPGGRAADLGCGVGKFTEALASVFDQVEACDVAATALEKARSACRSCSNIRFWRLDLTSDPIPFEPVDFVLCINVLMMPCLDQRLRAWRAVANQVARGGRLLLVAPALESVQMAYYRAVEDRLDAGDRCSEAQSRCQLPGSTASDLQQGVHLLEGARTKHYLRDELEEMIAGHGFDLEELERLSYPGSGAGAAPAGLWDWMVLAQRQ